MARSPLGRGCLDRPFALAVTVEVMDGRRDGPRGRAGRKFDHGAPQPAGLGAHHASGGAAQGTNHPSKPVSLIVPYAPGGTAAITACILADRAPAQMRQPVAAQSRPGANRMIGADVVAKALHDDLPFGSIADSGPVPLATRTRFALTVIGGLPVATAGELIKHIRAWPGRLCHASAGSGSNMHVRGEWRACAEGYNRVRPPHDERDHRRSDAPGRGATARRRSGYRNGCRIARGA